MPYIEAKMSIKLDEHQKDDLQKKLTDAVSTAFSKPKAYIMACIEDDKSLYMAERKLEKEAKYGPKKKIHRNSKDSDEAPEQIHKSPVKRTGRVHVVSKLPENQ